MRGGAEANDMRTMDDGTVIGVVGFMLERNVYGHGSERVGEVLGSLGDRLGLNRRFARSLWCFEREEGFKDAGAHLVHLGL